MRSAAFRAAATSWSSSSRPSILATALQDTRNKVQDAKRRPAAGGEEPTVNEVNLSEFPVLVVTLSGNVPERVLTAAARDLRDRIEEVPGVLEGDAPRRARRSRRGRRRPGEACPPTGCSSTS